MILEFPVFFPLSYEDFAANSTDSSLILRGMCCKFHWQYINTKMNLLQILLTVH